MNIKDNIVFLLCFFPIFAINSKFAITDYAIIFSFFLLLFFFHILILNYLITKNNFLIFFYKSFVIVFGIDNHLGLFNGLIQPNLNFFFKYFEIVYVPALLILLSLMLFLTFIFYFADQNKILKISIITMSVMFIFNLIDNTKSYKKVPYFEKLNQATFNEKTLVIVWDEMSGMNSLSSTTNKGKKFNKKLENFFQKYHFDYYPDAYSISKNSVKSLSSLVNFIDETNTYNRDLVKPSKNYFVEYELKENKFFDKFKSISVIQNIHINYCNNVNVSKCYQYNPLYLEKINAKPDFFSKIISNWSLNGSIYGKFTWRLLKQFNIIHSTLEPEGEKLYIDNILNFSKKDILSKNFDLVFIHLLVPHKPYGFNQECKYDVKLSNLNIFLKQEEHIKNHNIERSCVVNFMDNLLGKLNNLEKLRIIILSDHGSRITSLKNSSFTSIFAYKNFMQKSSSIKNDKISIQKIFKIINDE